MRWNFEKWLQTIKISLSNFTTYRFNFFLQVIGPGLVFFFIKYNLWSSIYNGDQEILIGGYTFQTMIQYHGWSMIVLLLCQGMTANNLSEDIRMGKISNYLIYPMNFWEFHTASFLAFEFLQIFICLITIFIISFTSLLGTINVEILINGFSYCIFVSIFWFSIQYLTGIIAFWLEETWTLRVIFSIISGFLSGAIIPLDLFPERWIQIISYTPFPYLTYYPIKIFMGEIDFFTKGYLILSLWLIIIILVNKLVWKKGIKMYTAAGM
jgi:ABC-2 type transport system permease protein